MRKLLRNRLLVGSFLVFISLNIFLYVWLDVFHGLLPFSKQEYLYNANHYKIDPRIQGEKFSLINALGQYDSQWYLKIADKGYPIHPISNPHETTKTMGGIMYIFFPLLPIMIAGLNLVVHNVEVSGFIFSNIILAALFSSIYYVVSRWFSETIAVKTIFLIMLYPFSIFLHGYYTEGLRLLFFIWICYFIQKKNYLPAAILIGLSCVTSGIALFLVPFFVILLWFSYTDKHLSFKKMLWYTVITGVPFLLWLIYCYVQTGNPVYFLNAFRAWERPVFPLLHNIGLIFTFPFLPARSFYGSQIDVLCIIFSILAAIFSRKVLPPMIWFMTLIFAFTSLFLQDSAAFARFTVVFFPYFVYLATVLKGKYYIATLFLFTAMLLFVSLGYINWYWIE
jgi:hypothetical protein